MPRIAYSIAWPALVALMLVAGASRAQASSLTFAGSSSGCFNCTASSLTDDPTTVGGLTFDGGQLTVNADGTVDLGTFTLALSTYNYSSHHTSFLLGVTFTDPAALDGSYTAEVEGVINTRQNGSVNIQLDQPYQTYNFTNATGFGSFDFGIYDPTLQLKPGDPSLVLMGMIRNVQFTLNSVDPVIPTGGTTGSDPQDVPGGVTVPAPVPEPGSVLLLGIGLAAAARRKLALSKLPNR